VGAGVEQLILSLEAGVLELCFTTVAISFQLEHTTSALAEEVQGEAQEMPVLSTYQEVLHCFLLEVEGWGARDLEQHALQLAMEVMGDLEVALVVAGVELLM